MRSALSRQVLLVDAPDFADVTPVLGIFDIPIAWELIALMSVLASPLAIALAGDGGVAAIRLADTAVASTRLMQALTFSTPLVWCSIPRACIRKLVFAWPHHSAARMIFSFENAR